MIEAEIALPSILGKKTNSTTPCLISPMANSRTLKPVARQMEGLRNDARSTGR